MKKIITAFMLLALVALPMFAASLDSDLNVKTTVSGISEYGFFHGSTYSTAATSALTGLVGSEEQVLGSSADTYSAVVRTNSNSGVKVELYSSELELKDGSGSVIDSIALYIDGSAYTSSSKKTLINQTSGSGLRIEQAAFALTYDTTAFASATVGDYHATVTMVVSGN
jgi:hypothetical protein